MRSPATDEEVAEFERLLGDGYYSHAARLAPKVVARLRAVEWERDQLRVDRDELIESHVAVNAVVDALAAMRKRTEA